jgi:endonuclease III
MNTLDVGSIVHALGLQRPVSSRLPLGNKSDPLDELFYIILTTMTQYGVEHAFDNLKLTFPSWGQLLNADAEDKLRVVIQYCGLVNQKAPQILTIAQRLNADFGEVTLDPLRQMSDSDAEAYLTSLPRVGKKVARCVMMYSLGRDVLPVDAHVLRVGKRISLLSADLSWAKAHDRIHEVVPAELRYSVHVGLVEHGRSICRHKNPLCSECVLRHVCDYRRQQGSSVGAE